MRLPILSLGLLALLPALTCAWNKDDREIFRVRDELAAHEGPDVTFYSFLGVKPAASLDDIDKAYKKKTRSLHPDKVQAQLQAERARANKKSSGKKKGEAKGVHVAKGPTQSEIKAAVKRASERQARLSIVANILRGAGRDRYDHFLANGFPVWKGTGYYYNRYRPGLGTALAGVFLFGGGAAHYLALYMGWRRRREFVERYIKFARHAAWGENLGIAVPGLDDAAQAPAAAAAPQPAEDQGPAQPVNRKMRRLQEKDAKREAARESSASKKGRGGGGGATAAAAAAMRRGGSTSGSATPQPQAQGGGPTGSKKRVQAENGKVLVVDSLGDVYLEERDAEGNTEEFLLDPNEIPCPTFRDTAVIRVPIWLYKLAAARLSGKKAGDEESDEEQEDEDVAAEDDVVDDEESESGKHTPSTDSAEGFELLEKSVDELGKAKASGSQKQGGGGKKRKGKKR